MRNQIRRVLSPSSTVTYMIALNWVIDIGVDATLERQITLESQSTRRHE